MESCKNLLRDFYQVPWDYHVCKCKRSALHHWLYKHSVQCPLVIAPYAS
jgi:hypothetical protein